MAKAIRYHKQGGPEVLQLDDIPVGEPGQGQVRIRHTAIGVNFVDTYQRSGLYPMQLPAVAGNEAAGVVDAVGPGVKDLKKGDRVAYTGLPGSYCEMRVVPADRMVKIPKGISDEQAASMMLKGMTVHYLIHSTYKVKKGDTVLWHAAAGGVGQIAGQWLKKLGAITIGTVGSDEKAKLAKAHGCKHVINYCDRELRREGEGDHQGQEAAGGLRRGRQDDLGRLARLPAAARPDGVVRQRLGPGAAAEPRHPREQGVALRHAADARHLHRQPRRPGEALDRPVQRGQVGQGEDRDDERSTSSPDAAQAHRDLEGRQTTGSVVLIP